MCKGKTVLVDSQSECRLPHIHDVRPRFVSQNVIFKLPDKFEVKHIYLHQSMAKEGIYILST